MLNGGSSSSWSIGGGHDSKSSNHERKEGGGGLMAMGGNFGSGSNGIDVSVVAGPTSATAGPGRLYTEFSGCSHGSQFLTRPPAHTATGTNTTVLPEQQPQLVDINTKPAPTNSGSGYPHPPVNFAQSASNQFFPNTTSDIIHDSIPVVSSQDLPHHHPRFASGGTRGSDRNLFPFSQGGSHLHTTTTTTSTSTSTRTTTTSDLLTNVASVNPLVSSRTTPLALSTTPLATTPLATTPLATSSHSATIRGSSTDRLPGLTMGHSEINRSSAWDLQENSSDKMDRAEGKNRDGDSISGSGGVSSPALTPLLIPQPDQVSSNESSSTGPNILGTPSTVSTAPSTDEASVGADSLGGIGMKMDAIHGGGEHFTLHRRAPSWESSPRQRHQYAEGDTSSGGTNFPLPLPAAHASLEGKASTQYWLPSHLSPTSLTPQQSPTAWAAAQPRVASFRNEPVAESKSEPTAHGYPQVPNGERWQQSRHFPGDPHLSYVASQNITSGLSPYQVARKPPVSQSQHYTQSALPPSPSPSRNPRNQRSQGPSPHRQQQLSGGGGSAVSPSANPARSSSEILKTLLRKKACLYEPDTSRAVALVTWLVGRVLALEYGFFSRQQLQAGVHACVAEKIDSGTITRTKVNRCMQIILNSCFHYIIPRPDGTEEKGASFRDMFAMEVNDDTGLLRLLPAPWNDLSVDKTTVIKASSAEVDGKPEFANQAGVAVSPKASPSLKSTPVSPGKESGDGDVADVKRAVLLCFNENVRAAEDVFRCHNEFIRDSAHSSNLQLSAQEWRLFFGKEAASTPLIWGNVGIPVVAVESASGTGSQRKPDVLGRMTRDEVGKFRTTWCAKRYDHDHELCGFAHVDVSGGWLRRNPYIYRYRDELCPSIRTLMDKRIGPRCFVINECRKGVHCEYAHSNEEMAYHPNRYKAKPCQLVVRGGVCRHGDICPNHHPSDSSRPTKKTGEGRPPSTRHARSGQSSLPGKSSAMPPAGSPILYASPAPVSSFEKQLLMPGLQNLFRRHCSVVRAHLRNPGRCRCFYSHFGDDMGIDEDAATVIVSGTRA